MNHSFFLSKCIPSALPTFPLPQFPAITTQGILSPALPSCESYSPTGSPLNLDERASSPNGAMSVNWSDIIQPCPCDKFMVHLSGSLNSIYSYVYDWTGQQDLGQAFFNQYHSAPRYQMKVVNLLELSSMRKMRPKPSSRVQVTVNSIMGDGGLGIQDWRRVLQGFACFFGVNMWLQRNATKMLLHEICIKYSTGRFPCNLENTFASRYAFPLNSAPSSIP